MIGLAESCQFHKSNQGDKRDRHSAGSSGQVTLYLAYLCFIPDFPFEFTRLLALHCIHNIDRQYQSINLQCIASLPHRIHPWIESDKLLPHLSTPLAPDVSSFILPPLLLMNNKIKCQFHCSHLWLLCQLRWNTRGITYGHAWGYALTLSIQSSIGSKGKGMKRHLLWINPLCV